MSDLFATLGYYLAALIAATLPAAILYWYLIHPLAGFWRRLGKVPAFTIVGSICLALAVTLWMLRDRLLAVHWGYHWPLVLTGIALYGLGVAGERKIRRELRFRVLVGAPELDRESPGRLLTEGPYARCRNPRYLNLLVAMLGFSLILDYPILYVELALAIPAIYLLVRLEERELAERFGATWEAYRSEVPRFLPRDGWIF